MVPRALRSSARLHECWRLFGRVPAPWALRRCTKDKTEDASTDGTNINDEFTCDGIWDHAAFRRCQLTDISPSFSTSKSLVAQRCHNAGEEVLHRVANPLWVLRRQFMPRQEDKQLATQRAPISFCQSDRAASDFLSEQTHWSILSWYPVPKRGFSWSQ